ncbi:alpha-mannosidase [Richelia sinica FACHB-800]|uniref:Alpha-mannosidase n=1 Tax=Richelia sinica FACHB-800 TaxID=1357546 RepID=A0A975T3W3_9NOST|nr:alpha-mannosidase [Richelia sinica]MBD2665261.1 alpha-mannosidase [Richelia sinica FACHB-800]QXE21470.1 alpha-mannosidase [Richelia sinica FACHB-800]
MTLPVSPANTKFIFAAIENLRSCCQVNIQSTWFYHNQDWVITEVISSHWSDWQPVHLNDKEHIAWSGGKQVLWLQQSFVVPQALQGYDLQGLGLRLALVWWADQAEVYVNGKLVGEGDLFDSSPRVLLSGDVKCGDEFLVNIRLVSPGHCDGALMRSLLVYESTDYNSPDPGFVADELGVIQLFLAKYAPDKLNDLAAAVEEVANYHFPDDWNTFLVSLRQKILQFHIPNLNSHIYLLGHAHLDLAWLWPVSETWNAAQNTFESALKLQQDFPELTFCHSTPALYAWIEEHRPDLFAAIKSQVDAGKWEIMGGFWVEPDLNLIAGESIVRQLLYGQRYFQEKFGRISPIVWVPDTFGFCATLPQFLRQAGIEYFVTQKLRWNDTTKFDYGLFWWRSPDGSQVLSFMSAPIGEGIDPIKMATYACEWHSQTELQASLWLPGVGDHGGGPTLDMLEIGRRWQHSPVFPKLEFTTAEKYLQQITSHTANLPVWEDELYLEFHRGCYTTHADQKAWNRRCENLLYQAELFATLAKVCCGVKYPQQEIETAWKRVLFNQFHDILPGSSITQVYEDALPEWQQVEEVGSKILEESLQAIASHINLPSPPHPQSIPVIVFNSLNWQRCEVATITLPNSPESQPGWQVYDILGNQLPSQQTTSSTLIFLASVPCVGYNIFWLTPSTNQPTTPPPQNWTLENPYLRIHVNPDTGDLSSVFDKTQQREIFSGAGNQIQGFQDSGQYWDAWNIDPNYHHHPLSPTQLKSIHWLEYGPVQQRLRVVRQLGASEFCQDYILQTHSPLLKIANTVNWQENQVLVKAAFPLNLEADFATYEIPCGVIQRTTKPQTPSEQAKWEVPALRWADLTAYTPTGKYGVSILNDCKYGYDATSNQLRLTLLRSPNWPDPQADRGLHQFTYAIYPHTDSWEQAQTVRYGYELNIPLQIVVNPPQQPTENQFLPITASAVEFFNLSNENLVLMALKPAEDNPEKMILRFYECQGKTTPISWTSNFFKIDERVNLLEETMTTNVPEPNNIEPWQIITLSLSPNYSR